MEPIPRRNMLSALLLAAAPALPASEQRAMMLAAPRNGAIQTILVKDGQHIIAGSKICELKPDDERLADAPGGAARGSRRGSARKLTPGYNDLLGRRPDI